MNHNHVDQQAVELLLKNINGVWKRGNFRELEKYFHINMVIEGPELQGRKEGRDQCVQHHEDFNQSVKFISSNESDYKIDVWGDTAIASYRFEVQFEADGHVRKESGHELYAFYREASDWKAVWNSIVPSTSVQ